MILCLLFTKINYSQKFDTVSLFYKINCCQKIIIIQMSINKHLYLMNYYP